jgi:hypothetical protein
MVQIYSFLQISPSVVSLEFPNCFGGTIFAGNIVMRILTLFLALFLTLLPEGVTYVNTSCGQGVCLEEICDIAEEEAVIRSPQRMTEMDQDSVEDPQSDCIPVFTPVFRCHFVYYCFERLWLTACMLRR